MTNYFNSAYAEAPATAVGLKTEARLDRVAAVEAKMGVADWEIKPVFNSFEPMIVLRDKTVAAAGEIPPVENEISGSLHETTHPKKMASGHRFQADMLNALGHAVIATDLEGHIIYWNKIAEKMYGWGAEEALGMPISTLVASGPMKKQAAEIFQSLTKGNTWSGEFSVTRKDGTEFPVLVTDSPIYDEQNNLVGIVGVSIDISEKKKLETLLDKANRLARIGHWEADLINLSVYWSSVTKEIHEVEADYVPDLEKGIAFYNEGKDRELISQAVVRAVESGIPYDLELQILTAKGARRWVRAIGEAEMVNGQCVRLYGSFQDISERRQNEEEQYRSEARFQALVENNYGAILLRDENLKTIYRSPYTGKITGYNDSERMGEKFIHLIHPDDVEKVKQHEQEVLKSPGRPLHLNYRLRHKLGHYLWSEEMTTNLLHDPSVRAVVSNLREISDRKKLEEQQELLASIVNSTDDAIISYSLDNVITSWNAGAEKLFQYKAGEVIGKKLSVIVPPYKAYEDEEFFCKVTSGEHIDHCETERLRKDGQVVEVSITVSAIRDAGGKIIGISKVARDITEINKSQEIIRQNEKRYRDLVDVLPVAIYTCDVEGRILLCNRAAIALWGREPKLGKDKWCGAWKVFNQNGDSVAFDNIPIARTVKSGTPVRGEELIIERPDGTRRNVLPFPTPLYGSSGLMGVLNMLLDVTEIRQYEHALLKSEEQYRQIVETAQEGIWVMDEKGKTAFVNQKLCQILGCVKEEIIGEPIGVFTDEAGRTLMQPIQASNSDHRPVNGDFRLLAKSGKEVWASFSGNAIFSGKGEYVGALVMITDITEKVALQRNLVAEQVKKQREIAKATVKAQEKERTEIGAELHDNVNQILAASSLFLEQSLIDPENVEMYVTKSRGYIANAIDEIRKLTKALVGPTKDKMLGLVSSIKGLIDDILLVKDIQIEFCSATFGEKELEEDLHIVIYRVVQEQLNNILKYANATHITIHLSSNETAHELSIKDNGNGFDASKKRGGIGLSNIGNRAELYNGRVEIVSSPGHGCLLHVLFPKPVALTNEAQALT
jgi:PAS domain S-box-containing protein